MRASLSRTALAGIAAGLSMALVVPTAGAAFAGTAKPLHKGAVDARHSWHGTSNPAEKAAKIALRTSIQAANAAYRTAVRTARTNFSTDPGVVAAKVIRDALIAGATDPQVIVDANAGFADAVSAQVLVRDAAVANALTTWMTAVDAAYTTYDTATGTAAEVAARAAFRAASRSAQIDFRAAMKSALKEYRTATALARATHIIAAKAAMAAFEASPKAQADADALHAAITDARSTFTTDAAVIAAKTTRASELATAKATYKSAMTAARDAFKAATGHDPHRLRPLLPGV